MPTYRISGLTVSSELELPGVAAIAQGEADVTIGRGPVPEHLTDAAVSGPIWDLDDRRFLLRLPGIGRFLATDSRIDIDPDRDASLADTIAFVLGTMFGALLHQRGAIVLHASVVASGGKAYAICGRSGIGKSTLAATLCGSGCDFVSDDIAAIHVQHGSPMVCPDGRMLKLFDGTIATLGLHDLRKGSVRAGVDKYYVAPPGGESSEAVPLGAIYMLRDAGPACPAGFTPLSGLDTAQSLLDESYRPRLARFHARGGRLMAATAAVAGSVPAFHFSRPRSPDTEAAGVAESAARLRAHWQTLGR